MIVHHVLQLAWLSWLHGHRGGADAALALQLRMKWTRST